MANLKLYIWTGFCPDYTGGLAFSIASSETEARRLIRKDMGCAVYTWGDLEVRPVNWRVGRCVSGGG